MPDRCFYRFFKNGEIDKLIDLLFVSGRSIEALAGFGAMETEWEPYSIQQVTRFVVTGPPEYEGKPPPTGLFSSQYLRSDTGLAAKTSDLFDTHQRNGYFILLRKGAEKLFASV